MSSSATATRSMAMSAPAKERDSVAEVMGASMVGTAIEFYDNYCYSIAAASYFGTIFFTDVAKSDPLLATIMAFVTFAVSFIARPFGSLLFGHFGDKLGRKKTLVVALMMMGIATFTVGLLPGYEQLGTLAVVLLCVCRACQGVGLAGLAGRDPAPLNGLREQAHAFGVFLVCQPVQMPVEPAPRQAGVAAGQGSPGHAGSGIGMPELCGLGKRAPAFGLAVCAHLQQEPPQVVVPLAGAGQGCLAEAGKRKAPVPVHEDPLFQQDAVKHGGSCAAKLRSPAQNPGGLGRAHQAMALRRGSLPALCGFPCLVKQVLGLHFH